MVGTVKELRSVLNQNSDVLATEIALMADNLESQRSGKMAEWKEQRDYVFATSTKTTSVNKNGWKNSTHIPKLCHLRDVLHANYMTALYPNDDHMVWEAQDKDGLDAQKAKAITTYISNKLKQQNFRATLSDIVYDYIDTGNAIAHVEYRNQSTTDEEGNPLTTYVGPVIVRDSVYDQLFNPLARTYKETPKITRELVSLGELRTRMEDEPENAGWMEDAWKRMKERRMALQGFRPSDLNRVRAFSADGFGTYSAYLDSGYIEVLNFEGTMYDSDADILLKNYVITVIDRDFVVRKIQNPSWIGESNYEHVAWRSRPDNLYGMGPMDNLVGMQYRIDHLENVKADLMDLIAHPPLKIKGQVEAFDWAPWAEIIMGDDGEVDILKVDSAVLAVENEISYKMDLMEEFAGAPKQSVGARTPGEKTAFEVQTLEQNSAKMYNEKVLHFDINFLEPLYNKMLESARRHLDGGDLVAVMDDDFGVKSFINISPADIKSRGTLRPMAARHYAARATAIQNLVGAQQFLADPAVANHISGKGIATLLELGLNLEKFALVRPNIRIEEQLESQALMQSGQQTLGEEQETETFEDIGAEGEEQV